MVAQQVKKSPVLYGIRRLNAVFARGDHRPLSQRGNCQQDQQYALTACEAQPVRRSILSAVESQTERTQAQVEPEVGD
jgi:hypothetical protein